MAKAPGRLVMLTPRPSALKWENAAEGHPDATHSKQSGSALCMASRGGRDVLWHERREES